MFPKLLMGQVISKVNITKIELKFLSPQFSLLFQILTCSSNVTIPNVLTLQVSTQPKLSPITNYNHQESSCHLLKKKPLCWLPGFRPRRQTKSTLANSSLEGA